MAKYHRIAGHIGAEVSPPTDCPTNVDTWLSLGQKTLGVPGHGLEAIKQFYSGSQSMTTWARGHLTTDQEAMTPPGTLQLICFDTHQAAVSGMIEGYLRSIPADRQIIAIPCQEPEGGAKWSTGREYVAWFTSVATRIRKLNLPNVKIAHDSASSAYATGKRAADGSFMPPNELVDVHFVDIYQNGGNWPSKGLANYSHWLGWRAALDKVGWTGRIGIAEYGIDSSKGDSARHDQMAMDFAYLMSGETPHLLAFLYWYSGCTAGVFQTDKGSQHAFTDAATLQLWHAALTGTLK